MVIKIGNVLPIIKTMNNAAAVKISPEQINVITGLSENRNSLLIGDCGFGKTATYLLACLTLWPGKRVTIVSPANVIDTIHYEITKWCEGFEDNFDVISWNKIKQAPQNEIVIFDECTPLSSARGTWVSAARILRDKAESVIACSATPATCGPMDLIRTLQFLKRNPIQKLGFRSMEHLYQTLARQRRVSSEHTKYEIEHKHWRLLFEALFPMCVLGKYQMQTNLERLAIDFSLDEGAKIWLKKVKQDDWLIANDLKPFGVVKYTYSQMVLNGGVYTKDAPGFVYTSREKKEKIKELVEVLQNTKEKVLFGYKYLYTEMFLRDEFPWLYKVKNGYVPRGRKMICGNYRSVSRGLNLQDIKYVVALDNTDNAEDWYQLVRRAYRRGNDKDVTFIYMVNQENKTMRHKLQFIDSMLKGQWLDAIDANSTAMANII